MNIPILIATRNRKLDQTFLTQIIKKKLRPNKVKVYSNRFKYQSDNNLDRGSCTREVKPKLTYGLLV